MVVVCLTVTKYTKNNCGLENSCGKYFYNVLNNLDLTYSSYVATLFFSLWLCNSRNRSRAMPHIKSYCRISPCTTKMSWFLLTSANLSKAAWGRRINLKDQKDQGNYIMAQEAGVLFLPKFVVVIYFFIL